MRLFFFYYASITFSDDLWADDFSPIDVFIDCWLDQLSMHWLFPLFSLFLHWFFFFFRFFAIDFLLIILIFALRDFPALMPPRSLIDYFSMPLKYAAALFSAAFRHFADFRLLLIDFLIFSSIFDFRWLFRLIDWCVFSSMYFADALIFFDWFLRFFIR